MTPKVNELYRHFKGNIYKVITVAKHTETGEDLVIYQGMYGDLPVFARPLSDFVSDVDREKYPDVLQQKRFEPVSGLVEPSLHSHQEKKTERSIHEEVAAALQAHEEGKRTGEEAVLTVETHTENEEEPVSLDPLLEQYLDADTYHERINILHGLRHRITDQMLTTMAVVIDFELPEDDINAKYEALDECLKMKEKYETNRLV